MFMRLHFLMIFLVCSLACVSETIKNQKPGELNKVLKAKDLNSIEYCDIVGPLNQKDINSLSKMKNLKEVDLRRANFVESKNNTYKFPCLDSLTTLRLSADFAENKVFDIAGLGEIKVLETPVSNIFINSSVNVLDTLKINSASHITLPHPVIRNQMVVKTLYKLDDAE